MVVEQIPIIDLGVIALVALFAGILFTRLKLSSSIGYILAGVLLGPIGLKFLTPGQGLAPIFGDIGIMMLMFYLGLELSIKKFKESGAIGTVLVSAEMLVSFVIGFIAAQIFGYGFFDSLVIGALMPMASTVIAVKFLLERNLMGTPEARIAISSLIVEDFIGILILIFIAAVSAQRSMNTTVLNAILFVIAMFFIVRRFTIWVVAALGMAKSTTVALYAIGVGILVSYFGTLLGVSPILGAYFAGFALAETAYGERIKKELGLFREFFILFFFVSFGSTILLPSSSAVFGLLALMLVLYVVFKIIVYGIFGTSIGISSESAITTGLVMLPIGEFGMLIAAAAMPLLSNGNDIIALSFLLTIVTTLISPALFNSRHEITRIFEKFYPQAVRGRLTAISGSVASLGHIIDNPLLQNDYSRVLRSMFVNLVIAVSILYMGFAVNYGINVPFIPKSVSVGLVALPLIIWPLYKFTEELRYLTKRVTEETIVSRLKLRGRKKSVFGSQAADLFTGLLMSVIGVVVSVGLYTRVDNIFMAVPVIYTLLALMYLSKSFYGLFEKYEDQSLIEGGLSEDAHLQGIGDFEEHSKRVSELNAARMATRERIQEALSAGDIASARSSLLNFRRTESKFMRSIVDRYSKTMEDSTFTAMKPSLPELRKIDPIAEREARFNPALQGYFIRRGLADLKEKEKKRKKRGGS